MSPSSVRRFSSAVIAARSKRWKASPSIDTALMPSRRKIWSKVCLTVVVPAPDEPVTEMIGCRALMPASGTGRAVPKSARVSASGRSW